MTNTPMLTEEEAEAWTAAYDRRGDTMYVNLKPNRAAFRAIEGPATIVRRYGEDGKLIGLTLLDAASPAPLAPLPNPLVLDSVEGDSYSANLPSSPSDDTGQWRDIESAPRDGTPIVVGRRNPSFGWIWGTAIWFDHTAVAGWISRGSGSAVADGLGLADPTHWMPLPNPPASDALLEREGVPTVEHPSAAPRAAPQEALADLLDGLRRRARECSKLSEQRENGSYGKASVIGKAKGYAHAAELLEALLESAGKPLADATYDNKEPPP